MKDIIDRLDRIIDILTTAKEEREKSPHTPLKEKGEAPRTVKNARARTREIGGPGIRLGHGVGDDGCEGGILRQLPYRVGGR